MAFWNRNDAQKDIDEQLREINARSARQAKENEEKFNAPRARYAPPQEQLPANPPPQPKPPVYTSQKLPPAGRAPAPKKSNKAAVIVSIAVALLMLVPMIVEEISDAVSDNNLYWPDDYEWSYEATEAIEDISGEENLYQLQWAVPGDIVRYGGTDWEVLAHEDGEALLLCEIGFWLIDGTDGELLQQLNETFVWENNEGVWLGDLGFSMTEFEHLKIVDYDDNAVPVYAFLLTEEELEQYGVTQREESSDGTVFVYPAVRVIVAN